MRHNLKTGVIKPDRCVPDLPADDAAIPAHGGVLADLVGRPSMGTVDDASDNAMAKGFFASLKGEVNQHSTFQRKAQTRMAVCTWIEGSHSSRRRHIGVVCFPPEP